MVSFQREISKAASARPDRVVLVTFLCLFAWKALLLVLAALPVPSNDSFFYDGAVVNLLEHGRYANPAIALALPISGTQVFSAYPPLYQAVLLGWMWMFGTSALSAMALHLILFGVYMGLLLALFRRLEVSTHAALVGALFLLAITFHDRPDSLAHVLGMGAIYAWVRSLSSSRPALWHWQTSVLAILCVGTGLQIGALYMFVLWVGVLAASWTGCGRFPLVPMLVMAVVPLALVAMVHEAFPLLWSGFAEHARQTPSLTGFRVPRPDEILKLVRNVPGTLAVGALVLYSLAARLKGHTTRETIQQDVPAMSAGDNLGMVRCLVLFAAVTASLLILGAALFIITPNSIGFTLYLQPLIVGLFLSSELLPPSKHGEQLAGFRWLARHRSLAVVGFIALAALTSIRAVGLSTWGLACAWDFGYRDSQRILKRELAACRANDAVVLSSAYLYTAAHSKDLRWVHCDWLQPANRYQPEDDWEGLIRLRPAVLVLTQFDYYRRFQPVVARLSNQPELAEVVVADAARVRPPDAIPPLRRVVQHLSWAPVIVRLNWTQ